MLKNILWETFYNFR